MKIDDRLSNYMSILNSESAKPAARAKGSADQPSLHGSDAVSVELSSAASQMAEDEARLEKLHTIRQQLAEGSYNISGKDVAEKMLKILQG
ncbi:MAG: flagellar biosynthesis anti-sigma factor FlgM [Deltaproteobacteria bacterium]